MVAALVIAQQAIVARGHLAGEAVVLEILAHVLAAAHRLVDDQLVVDVLRQVLDSHHMVILEAAHILVGIVAAVAQEVGAVVAPRNGLLFALARGAHNVLRLQVGEVQYVGHDVVAGQTLDPLGAQGRLLLANGALEQQRGQAVLVLAAVERGRGAAVRRAGRHRVLRHHSLQAVLTEHVQAGQDARHHKARAVGKLEQKPRVRTLNHLMTK